MQKNERDRIATQAQATKPATKKFQFAEYYCSKNQLGGIKHQQNVSNEIRRGIS